MCSTLTLGTGEGVSFTLLLGVSALIRGFYLVSYHLAWVAEN